MPKFRTCNHYYLRLSETDILPLYVFLDEQHVDFMSDRVLQHMLADLRPLVLPKLMVEADAHLGPGRPPNAKKGSVEVCRGDTYQFCFFFRKTEPHTVLVKTRNFVAAPVFKETQVHTATLIEKPRATKRKGQPPQDTTEEPNSRRKKRKLKPPRNAKRDTGSDGESAISIEDHFSEDDTFVNEANVPRRSGRKKRPIPAAYRDEGDPDFVLDSEEDPIITHDNVAFDMDEPVHEPPSILDLQVEEEETKPKPIMKLGFKSFRIHGHSLCVVVEPWPRPSSSHAPSRRARSIAPSNFELATLHDAGPHIQTPLFLPDSDRADTPQERSVPSLDDDNYQSDDGGMMQFSQVLNVTGDFRAGANDDDGMDETVFFGDADEGRD